MAPKRGVDKERGGCGGVQVGNADIHDLICILGNIMLTKEGSGQGERRQRRRARSKSPARTNRLARVDESGRCVSHI